MNLTEACLALEVSRSGYHDHLRKPRGKRRQQDQLLACALREEFALSRQTYGSPRLVAALRQRGLRHGKNRVSRLMREQHLHVRQKRRFVPRTTQADKASHPSPNLLGAQPAPTRSNQAWVTDITYLPTGEGWLYVAAEMDLYSRRIIGWDAGPSLATELPGSALQRALATRRGHDLRDLLHHSDRGCQYTSHAFRHQLVQRGITQSMSRAGNCYDNAAIESFWATLKTECFGTTIPDTRTQARAMLFDYIETFYNPVRLHSSLNFLSPLAFEKATQLN
jgi:transposase InsO family protein